jgi:hypothetical protein
MVITNSCHVPEILSETSEHSCDKMSLPRKKSTILAHKKQQYFFSIKKETLKHSYVIERNGILSRQLPEISSEFRSSPQNSRLEDVPSVQ